MGLTHFPHGVTSLGVPVLPGTSQIHTGNVFFVHNGTGADGNVGDSANPFATIDYAIGMCTANNDDVIYVKRGHTSTLSSAGAITADVSGITIEGLGNANQRPILTWATTDASFLVTAANVTLKNIITTISVDEVVSMFAVSAAGVTLDAVSFVPYASGQAIQFLLTTAAADQLTIQNCNHRQTAAAGSAQKWIQLVGTDNTRILNNTIWMTAYASTASHAISGSTAVVECEIVGNRIAFLGATITIIINLVTGSTGIITDNRLFGGAAVVLAAAITGDAAWKAENYISNTAAGSGIVGPIVDVVT